MTTERTMLLAVTPMQRAMLAFHQDAQADWVAELACGHSQHVRHRPPFETRAWVTTAEGRASRIGQLLECPLCDRGEIPEGFVPYKRTAEFTNDTIPAGLLREHRLKAGVWGRLTLLEGSLAFTFVSTPPTGAQVLSPESPAIIPPEVAHFIAPVGPVRFFIEFWGRAVPA